VRGERLRTLQAQPQALAEQAKEQAQGQAGGRERHELRRCQPRLEPLESGAKSVEGEGRRLARRAAARRGPGQRKGIEPIDWDGFVALWVLLKFRFTE
jgi:hypothetical protein